MLERRMDAQNHIVSLITFAAAFIVAGAIGQGLMIVPGVSVTFWPPAGIFLAMLLVHGRARWLPIALTAVLAELVCNALWFRNPLGYALLYALANLGEATLAALLIERFTSQPFQLATLRDVLVFVAVTIAAPVVGATGIALIDQWRGRMPFGSTFPLVWLGDGSGLLVSTPLTLAVVQGWRERRTRPLRATVSGALGVAAILLVGGLALQGLVPSVYLTLPPVLWLAARFRLQGASVGIALVALLVGTFLMRGSGIFAATDTPVHHPAVMMQTFLVVTVVSALAVAVLALQHARAVTALTELNAQLEARVAERTERLRGSEERFRLAADAINGIIYEFTPATGRVERTRGLSEVLGYATSEVPPTAEWWAEQIHPDDRHMLRDWPSPLGNVVHNSYRIRHRDGRWLRVDDRAVLLTDEHGALVRMVGCTTDITERTAAEERLRESEAHQRRLAASLAEADHRKTVFLATLAHELRNPLAPIANGLHLVRHGSDDARERACAMMERQLKQLVRLVDDLLDVSRVSHGKVDLRLDTVLVQSVVEAAVETCTPIIEEGRHRLRVQMPSAPILLVGDSARLTQVIANLLHNSAKYMHAGGDILVHVAPNEQWVEIGVTDRGVGIPPDMLDGLFELFTQGEHAPDMSKRGLGIGLSLVKALVELHGGTVRASSQGVGRGSTFTVRLPLHAATGEAAPPSTGALEQVTTDPLPLRVLVVDDNTDAAESMAQLLAVAGYQIRTAHDGAAALGLAEAFRPHVVLMDIGMPRLSGHDAARAIRAQSWGQQMVLVALSGWGRMEDQNASARAGFDRHMVKPVDPSRLLSLLHEVASADRSSATV